MSSAGRIQPNPIGYCVEDILTLEAEIKKLEAKNARLLDFLEDGTIDREDYRQRKESNDLKIREKEKLKKEMESAESGMDEKEKTLQSVRAFVKETLEFPKAGGKERKIPDVVVNTYVNSINVCAGWVFEYNIRVNPDAEVELQYLVEHHL